MNPAELLELAKQLVAGGMITSPGHPSDTELRRAVSCVYYALFHTLCRSCADALAGQNPTGILAREKWTQVYRGLDHGPAKSRCNNNQETGKFVPEIRKFAEVFVDLQQHRHEADYNPDAVFNQSQVQQFITEAETTTDQFNGTSADARRLFAVYLHVRIRQT